MLFRSGKANKALLSCDALYSLIEKEQDKNIYFNYQYLLGLAQISLLQQSLAKKAAEECKKVACELKDDFLLFKSEVLACYAKYLSWKDLFLCDYQESNPEVFVDKLKKYGYFNLLAYVYGFEFENNESEFEAIAIGEKQPEFMLKSKTISRELKNQYCVLAVIIKNIIKYTDAGYHLYVETLYEERFQILHEMTNPIREGYAFIGLGYNSIIREEYEKANQLFNYGLQIMYQAKESERCAEVLYNMAINCIMAENYKLANDYLIAILKIIKLIEITTLHICNQSKLYGLIALCNFYMGIEYNAFLYFTKLEKILGHLLEEDKEIDNYWSEDLLLYYFLMALFHKKQNEVEKAIISLEKAFGYYESTEGVKYFYCVFLTQELSSCYFLLHQNEKAYAVIQEGLQYCRQKDLTHKIYQLESFMNSSDKEVIDAHVEEIAVSIDDILMNAKNDSMQLQLKERQRDIDFIALWQDTIGKFSYSGEMLIHNSMPALQNMYQLDGLIFVSDNNGEMDIRYSDSGQEITEKMCKKIFSYFKRMPFAFVSNRDDKDFLEYREIIGLFNQTKVVAILGIPIIRNRYVHSFLIGYTKLQQRARANRTNLTSADLIATKFAFSQLMDKLEQLESQHEIQAMNEKLRYSAIFDQLTNLYNRKGFHEKMGYYQKRYEVRNSTQVLLYLDLDNFKFYNDNFGHEIGDMVLVAFSKLLIDCKKEEGCVVRYGGDEFLIVFPNKDAKYAVGIANDIYRKMDKKFYKHLQEMSAVDISVAEEKQLGCSIGIAEFYSFQEKAINEAINQADQALYEMKHHSKGGYKVYQIKEEVSQE